MRDWRFVRDPHRFPRKSNWSNRSISTRSPLQTEPDTWTRVDICEELSSVSKENVGRCWVGVTCAPEGPAAPGFPGSP